MVFEIFYLENFPKISGVDADLDIRKNFWDKLKYKNDLTGSLSAIVKRVDAL